MKKTSTICAAILTLLFLWEAAQPRRADSADLLKTMVSVAPQRYFVEKIGGDRVHVEAMVPEGASPATFDPSPGKIRQLSDAALYFAVGVPFEKTWLEKFARANPLMRTIMTHDGIERFPMASHHAHHGAPPDPHVWLSPPLVAIQARNIMLALCKADPVHRRAYQANYGRFMAELVNLDLKIQDFFPGNTEKIHFMVYHPSWGYFARAYGLEQVPVEMAGKTPTGKTLTRQMQTAKRLKVKIIFAQPQFSTKSAQLIADAIGGKVVIADPLAPDWAANLLDVAHRFRMALR
ncbi:MAG: zinc ABC transporter substrate-binding protein [Deltaproteobacteria bacterium]|nr:zinc ABC transporter substrate-binding protein [Deltaproteobacteria bacterium]